MDPVFILLVVICVLCCCFFCVSDDEKAEQVKGGRDFAKEHALGAHRHTPAWGCPQCR